MKIIHIAPFMGNINGIAEVVVSLTEEQLALDNNILILSSVINDIYGVNKNIVKCTTKKEFENIVTDFKPDIVIFHSLYKMTYVSYANILKKKRIPYAVEFHGAATKQNRVKGYLKKRIADILIFNNFIKNAAGVIYLNEDEKKSSVYSDITKKDVIVPNGLYLNKLCAQKEPQSANNIIEFIYMGRIDYCHKGLDVLFSALKKMKQLPISKKIHFSFFGKGRDLCLLEEDIAKIPFAEYKGLVYGNEKEKAFNASDIFILTSRYEGMPMGILEALSCGCPCLITEATNMASIVKDEAGWITPLTKEGIVETIHKAIKDYQNNKEKYRNKSIEIAKQFDWKNVAKLSIENYKNLL